MKFNKLHVLLLLTVLCIENSNAQKWFPIGAKWYYNYIPSDANELEAEGKDYNHYFTYEVEKDTIIEGETCQKLISKYYRSETEIIDWESQYVRYDEDSNKVYHYWDNEFHMLYDFTLAVGDTFKTTLYSYPHNYFNSSHNIYQAKMIVDSINNIMVNGENLRIYYFNTTNDLCCTFGNNEIIERIGGVSLLFGMENKLNDIFPYSPRGPLRCYEDNQISYIYDTKWSSCDYLNGVKENLTDFPFVIKRINNQKYLVEPNKSKEYDFYLYNANGVLLDEKIKTKGITKFNFNNSGLYLITIRDEKGNFYYQKILIK